MLKLISNILDILNINRKNILILNFKLIFNILDILK